MSLIRWSATRDWNIWTINLCVSICSNVPSREKVRDFSTSLVNHQQIKNNLSGIFYIAGHFLKENISLVNRSTLLLKPVKISEPFPSILSNIS